MREQPSAAVHEFFVALAGECGWQTSAFLPALNERLLGTTRQVIRHEGAAREPAETLRSRQGSCRDLAVLLCAA